MKQVHLNAVMRMNVDHDLTDTLDLQSIAKDFRSKSEHRKVYETATPLSSMIITVRSGSTKASLACLLNDSYLYVTSFLRATEGSCSIVKS